jgi:hypothetical protein
MISQIEAEEESKDNTKALKLKKSCKKDIEQLEKDLKKFYN